jgi:hypothetical protein
MGNGIAHISKLDTSTHDMNYFDKYIKLRDELWSEFESLVKVGAKFQNLLDVNYPRGQNPIGLSKTTDGDSWFFATEIVANAKYKLQIGEDLIVGTGKVTFIDVDGKKHKIEPDILDLFWLSNLIDNAQRTK